MRSLIAKLRSWMNDGSCNYRTLDDSHVWYEFNKDKWKCAACGFAVAWPGERLKEEMGIDD